MIQIISITPPDKHMRFYTEQDVIDYLVHFKDASITFSTGLHTYRAYIKNNTYMKEQIHDPSN